MKQMLRLSFFSVITANLIACSGNKQAAISVNETNSSVETAGIIHGTSVSESDDLAKSIVGVQMLLASSTKNDPKLASCTATLISENMILTAAHCLYGTKAASIIFSTDMKGDQKAEFRRLLAPMIHKGYKHDARLPMDDIAIAYFEGGIPAGYKALEIADAKELTMMHRLTLTGFGLRDEVDTTQVGQLYQTKANIDYMDNEYKQIDVDQEKTGICSGDSGGPGLIQTQTGLKIIGVNSFVSNPFDSHRPCEYKGTLTNATLYKDWVEQSKNLLLQKVEQAKATQITQNQ